VTLFEGSKFRTWAIKLNRKEIFCDDFDRFSLDQPSSCNEHITDPPLFPYRQGF